MDSSQTLILKVEKYGAQNYKPLPVVLNRAAGSRVWDVEGKEYIDFLATYSALNFGHQHPRLVDALKRQLDRIAVCSRAFHSEELCYFSEELARFCGHDAVLPMNSGTEAVETAIKLARKWGYTRKGVPADKAEILVCRNNFHGRSIAIVSFSSEPAYRDGFGPFAPGFVSVPFGDAAALEKAMTANTVAVLLEPIQAEAGILVPPAGYLAKVSALCREKNILFMADEIQTGLGRTGRDFCVQHDDVVPDVFILGKSLGGGLIPLSAVVANRNVMDVLRPGQHGSTFGGNPLACAVGREAIRLLKEEKLSERAQTLGELAMGILRKEKLPHVKEIRGRGALIGIEMDATAGGARRYCERIAERGVLCKETHDHVIRIAPPLTTPESDVEHGVGIIVDVIRQLAP